MSGALGLSVGATNLVAVRPGRMPVTRHSALVASDGFTHRDEMVLATALNALAHAADGGERPDAVVVAVPAHWGPEAVGALRRALADRPALSPGGVAPMVVSDTAAALAALQMNPGLPSHGVVALCDFGGNGTSITLADAGADLATIGETLRLAEFSGDRIDQALLNHVLAGVRVAATDDTSSIAAGPLARLREECRLAKERLSTETATVVPVDLTADRSGCRLTRAELESVMAPSLADFHDALGDALERNRIPAARLAAVACVGGGAAIPVIRRQLSEALRVPVITSPTTVPAAAAGAALIAARGTAADAPTGITVAAADAPTDLAPTAWAAGAAGRAATESASDGSPSATHRALAWSQDDDAAKEPVPYAGGDYRPHADAARPPATGARPGADVETGGSGALAVEPDLPWFRRPALIFGIAAVLAAVAVGGLAMRLTNTDSTPTTTTTRVTKPGEEPATPAPPPPTPGTGTGTGTTAQPTVTTVTTTAAPPQSSSATTTTTTPPTTTTTTTTSTTTSTTTTTTTTAPTTTRTTTTTTQPPTTSAAPPTTTAAPPTTTVAPPTTTVAPAATTTAAATAEPVVTTTPAPPG